MIGNNIERERNILIIEDNFDNRMAALAAMRELSLGAVLTSNVNEAIRLLDKNDFFAVFSDVSAGKSIIRECIVRYVPHLIVSANSSSVEILYSPITTKLLPEEDEEIFLCRVNVIFNRKKEVQVWKRVYKILLELYGEEYLTILQEARKRYRIREGEGYKMRI